MKRFSIAVFLFLFGMTWGLALKESVESQKKRECARQNNVFSCKLIAVPEKIKTVTK